MPQEQIQSYGTVPRNILASSASSTIYTNNDSSISSEAIPGALPVSFFECSKRDHQITLRYREMELEKAEFKFKQEKAELELKQYENELELKLKKEKIDLEVQRKKVESSHKHGVPLSNPSEGWEWRDVGMAVAVVILVVLALAVLVLFVTAFVMVLAIPIDIMACWILGAGSRCN